MLQLVYKEFTYLLTYMMISWSRPILTDRI